jgi:hypothetical protein
MVSSTAPIGKNEEDSTTHHIHHKKLDQSLNRTHDSESADTDKAPPSTVPPSSNLAAAASTANIWDKRKEAIRPSSETDADKSMESTGGTKDVIGKQTSKLKNFSVIKKEYKISCLLAVPRPYSQGHQDAQEEQETPPSPSPSTTAYSPIG